VLVHLHLICLVIGFRLATSLLCKGDNDQFKLISYGGESLLNGPALPSRWGRLK
jgi:hypothetical protein